MLMENPWNYSEKIYKHRISYFERPVLTNMEYNYDLLHAKDPHQITLKIKDPITIQHETELQRELESYPEKCLKGQNLIPTDFVYRKMPVIVKLSPKADGSIVIVRGEMLSLEGNKMTAFLVDEGYQIVVPLNAVFPVTLGILRIPKLGHRVRLAQLCPPEEGEIWTENVANQKLYEGKQSQTVFFHEYVTQNEAYEVTLLLDNLNLSIRLQHAGWAVPKPLSFSRIDGNSYPRMNYSPWLELKMIAFVVRTFRDRRDNLIKCAIQFDSEMVTNIQNDIDKYIANPKTTKTAIEKASPGLCCLAKYGGDDGYYRAKILNSKEGMAQIEYVDYKDHALVSVKDLLNIPEYLTEKPEAAVICCVTDLFVNKYDDLDKVSEILTNKDVYAVIDSCDPSTLGDTLCVTLTEPIDYETGTETSITKHFLEEPKTSQLVHEVINEIQPVSKDTGDLFLRGGKPSIFKFQPGCSPFVSVIISWDSIFLQMEEDIPLVESLSEELRYFYDFRGCDEQNRDIFLKELSIGDYVVARVKEEGKFVWYRAKVVEDFEPDKGVTVHFFDYGNRDFVLLENIFPLHQYFLKIPIGAYEFSLKGRDLSS